MSNDKILQCKELQDLLIKHEGRKSKPYKCTAGKTTIGVGRNLDDKGLSYYEQMYLLNNDIDDCIGEAKRNFSFYEGLSNKRKQVIVSMIFNLGLSRFMKFRKAIAAMEVGDFELAAKEMLDSRWATQVGKRSHELANMMIQG